MRYIIYTRVSTNKQTVENQLKECREYVYKLTQKGDEVIEFSEPDSSTKKPMRNRKKLIEMMAKLRKGDQLIVYKVDRLARDKQELVNIFCDIKKMGVDIYGIKDPSLSDDTILMYAMIASAERKNIIDRTVSALNKKRSAGERVGGTIYGYNLDKDKLQLTRENAHSYKKPFILVKNEEESKQIDIMIDLYQKGKSFSEICSELSAQGYRNRAGNEIQKMTVYRILKRLGKLNQDPMAQLYA